MTDSHELWLPTSVVKVTVIDGEVRVWDEMTMERRPVKRPTGFANSNQVPTTPAAPSREVSSPNKEKESS